MADSRMAYVWQCSERQSQFERLYRDQQACSDDSKLVSIFFAQIKILVQEGAAYPRTIKPEHMGIHPANRAGKKMMAMAMQNKGFKIWKVGFALELCCKAKAVAFEDDPSTRACEKHTIDTTRRSPYFGQYAPGSVQAGSVGASHLNQFLHAVLCGAKSDYKALCNKDSKCMSASVVAGSNEGLLKVFDHGLEFMMIKFAIGKMYPHFPPACQRALNVEHHVGQGDISN